MKCYHWLHRFVGAGLLLAASIVPAIAADDGAGKDNSSDDLFKQLDRNSDGEIVADEVGPEQQRMFQRLLRNNDQNNDGKLSRDEFLAATKETPPPRETSGNGPRGEGGPRREGGPSPEQAEMMFKQLDANSDGKLVLEEVPEERRPRFAILIQRADADGDQALTLVEFTKGLAMARGDRAGGGSPGQPNPPMPMGPGETIFRALDTNSDGMLSKDEIQAAPKSLEKLDRDGDGEITRRELGGPRPYQSAGQPGGSPGDGAMALLHRMDTDKDGKLSKDEVGERMRDNFDRLDANSDGYIDASELGRMLGAMRGRRPDGQGRPEGQGRPDGQRPDPKQMLQRLDSNQDGKLSKDEVPEWMRGNFDRIDANGDGFIDADELAQAMARNRDRQPGGRKRPADGDQK
ncbi:MAG TPA: EF-hand domain-containing protein [Pirellulales bacterium]